MQGPNSTLDTDLLIHRGGNRLFRAKTERQLNEPGFECAADVFMYRYSHLTPEKGLAMVMNTIDAK